VWIAGAGTGAGAGASLQRDEQVPRMQSSAREIRSEIVSSDIQQLQVG
jgi:hypothetical protein